MYVCIFSFFFFLKFSLSSSILLSSVSSFMSIYLNSLSGRLLLSIQFSSFPGILSCSFVWKVFLCLLILPLYVCFYVLDIPATSPDLERMALFRRWLVGSSDAVPPGYQSRCSRGVSCVGCVHLPVVVGPWLLRCGGWQCWPPGQLGGLTLAAAGTVICRAGLLDWELPWRSTSAGWGLLPGEERQEPLWGGWWVGQGWSSGEFQGRAQC